MKTLVTDGFGDEVPEVDDNMPTGDAYVIYGENSWLDDVDEHTVERLHMIGALEFVRLVKYPGGRTHLYVSKTGKAPKEK